MNNTHLFERPADVHFMQRALELARQGQGFVEPNPMVGSVVVDQDGQCVGEGFHQQFGGPHAEVHALRASKDPTRNHTIYVTLEPCCHTGKTPPCTQAILNAGIKRVVVAMRDPFPKVDGGGLKILREAGLEITVGVLEKEARQLNRAYLTRVQLGRPYVHAKWAMTLDGKIATRTGHSQWITGRDARQHGHRFRGLLDGIVVGRGTVDADDPQLTARPPGPRTPTRVVLDASGQIDPQCKLVQTAREIPTLIVAQKPSSQLDHLQSLGCEIVCYENHSPTQMLAPFLQELGKRGWTNLLVEGGSTVLGSFLDANFIDSVRVYMAMKAVGGKAAPGPIGGLGLAHLNDAFVFDDAQMTPVGNDWFLEGHRMQAETKDA